MGSVISTFHFAARQVARIYNYLFVKPLIEFIIRKNTIIDNVDIDELNIPKNTTKLLCIRNTFTTEIFKEFFMHLSDFKNLDTLYFSNTNMQNTNLHYINMLSKLQNLIITECENINILSLFVGIHKRPLKELSLSYNGINDITIICNGLRYFANTLEKLNLKGNLFGDYGIYKLCEVLPHLHKLKSLLVVHNEITDDGLLLLINVLPKIPLLEHLEIDRNNMTSSVYEILTNTLNKLPNIKHVHIEQTMASGVSWENKPKYYVLCS